MGTGSSRRRELFKLVPISALRQVPQQNRKRLLELNLFFAENFGLDHGKVGFPGLVLSLATKNHEELGTLHGAANAVSKRGWKKVTSLAPEKLIALLDDTHTEPAFLLSVLKALENKAIVVDETLVRNLFAFQIRTFQNSWGKSRIMTSGAFLAMLENPECATDWVTENTAFRLATLSNSIVTKDREENDKRFLSLAAELRKSTFSVENLDALADRISKPLCRDTWPELQVRK